MNWRGYHNSDNSNRNYIKIITSRLDFLNPFIYSGSCDFENDTCGYTDTSKGKIEFKRSQPVTTGGPTTDATNNSPKGMIISSSKVKCQMLNSKGERSNIKIPYEVLDTKSTYRFNAKSSYRCFEIF